MGWQPSPTVPPSPRPRIATRAATTNLVVQPGFESGQGIWQGDRLTIDCDDGDPAPRSGACHVSLGGWGSIATELLGQRGIVLPEGSPKTLRFFTRIVTNEVSATPSDKLFVRVIADGVTTTVATLSNLDASPGYVQRSLSLAAHAGKTVEIRFVGVENSTLATSFLVDDVSVQ